MAKWTIDKINFDEQYEKAVKKAQENDLKEPRAKSAKYDKRTKRIMVDLTNGATFIVPVHLIQGLSEVTEQELSEVKITPSKSGLSWDKLDVHFSIVSLMAGMFGNSQWMSELGRVGGKVKSPNKALTSKENGKSGGRPKKKARDWLNLNKRQS